MMTKEEMFDLGDNTVAFTADGHIGLLIGWPFESREEALIQVPGEEEARHIHPSKLSVINGALIEDGAPVPDPGESFDQWEKRKNRQLAGDAS